MKRTRLILVFGLLIVLTGFRGSGVWQVPTSSRLLSVLQGSALSSPQPLTLLEAWDLVDAHAKKWQPNAGVASIQSVDTEGDSASSGQDGRRRAWLAYLLDLKSSTELVVRLVDGVITEEFTQHADIKFAQVMSKPNLDSPQALAIARAVRPNFDPAAETSPAEGFHFTIQGKLKETIALAVGGYFRGKPAFIRLDSTTGNVIEALTQTYAQLGGILYSSDAGQTWQASNLTGRMVISVCPDPSKTNQAYASATQDGSIVIYQTNDGGRTWSLLTKLPDTAGDWSFQLGAISRPSHELTLVVSTRSGLWVSENGKTWAVASGLPGTPVWLSSVQSSLGDRLFVSILAGENPGVYATNDLSNWKPVAKGKYRLSQSFDRKTVLATDEFQVGKSMLFTSAEEKVSSIPGSALRVVGDFSDPVSMILDDSKVGVGKLSNQQVNQTVAQSGASLAVPPNFSSNRTVILGGFRTGLYRSVDAGKTWVQVLADPSKIVPGSNEIYEVQFLSNTSVIAINGGGLTWRDF